jgi:LytS/YehU family sensor histidine kinase
MASRSESIDQLAAKLDRDARSIPAVYLAIGLVAGLMFGVALGGDTVDVQRVAGIAYGLLGAFIGWSAGKSRQTSLRLQASTARKRR